MNPDVWLDLAAQAWNAGEEGRHQDAFDLYAQAERHIHGGMRFSPALNLLRHGAADKAFFDQINGFVIDIDPTEDGVFGLQTTVWKDQSPTARRMRPTQIDFDGLVENLRAYHFNAGYHFHNIKSHQPHLLVMSTGRCGTIGLHRLLQRTQYQSHHSFYFNVSHVDRLEQMCRYMDGQYGGEIEPFWLKTRAAEWIGPIQAGMPMAICNHHDTIFAPTFALLHRRAKLIYLRRNPRDVFLSMYGKMQWGKYQLRPIFYRFDKSNQWHWRDQNLGIPEQINWYLKFTEIFSRAVGKVIPDRWIEIDADKLFKRDADELIKLKEFAELDISLDEMIDHYGTVFNRKAHKLALPVSESIKVYESL